MTDVSALDHAIRDQRHVYQTFVRELTDAVMHPDGVPVRIPFNQTLVALYKLIDLVTIANGLLKDRPDIESLGNITRDELPGTLLMLTEFAACYERTLKVNRSMLLGSTSS